LFLPASGVGCRGWVRGLGSLTARIGERILPRPPRAGDVFAGAGNERGAAYVGMR